jgi:hypothetical protein
VGGHASPNSRSRSSSSARLVRSAAKRARQRIPSLRRRRTSLLGIIARKTSALLGRLSPADDRSIPVQSLLSRRRPSCDRFSNSTCCSRSSPRARVNREPVEAGATSSRSNLPIHCDSLVDEPPVLSLAHEGLMFKPMVAHAQMDQGVKQQRPAPATSYSVHS